jgi:chromosome segregation ATPase
MKGFLYCLLYSQAPPVTREGVPYWILWFLLCIILLLLTFIFLRDKNLRQRLNSFFFGAKKKLIKLRVQSRLKRENKKLNELLKALGQKTWEMDIDAPKAEGFHAELTRLEDQRRQLENESQGTQTRLLELERALNDHLERHKSLIHEQKEKKQPYQEENLQTKEREKNIEKEILEKQKQLENSVKERHSLEKEAQKIKDTADISSEEMVKRTQKIQERIKDMTHQREVNDSKIKILVEEKTGLERARRRQKEKIEEYDKKIKELEDKAKKKTKDLQKEIKKWEQRRIEIEDKIESTEKKKEPLFENLGKRVNRERTDMSELIVFYSQIDRVDGRIKELEKQIKEL